MNTQSRKVLVVGDLHSNGKAFQQFYDLSIKENIPVISLGDLVDRGTSPALLFDQLSDLKARGLLEAVVVGNHDHKNYRYRLGQDVKMAHDNLGTAKFFSENPQYGKVFDELITDSYLMYRLGTHYFVHAAMLSGKYESESIRYSDFLNKLIPRKNLDVFLYGFTTGKTNEHGFPERKMDWIDSIPTENTVWKGHDYMYNEVKVVKGSRGGSVVFMDTSGGVNDNLSGVVVEV